MVQEGNDAKLPCPRCHISLVDVKVADTPLEECTRCGGLWIDVSSFEFICSNAEAHTNKMAIRIRTSTRKAVARTANPAGRIGIEMPSGVSAVTIVSIAEVKPG